MKKIIKYLGEILLVLGSFITIYNLFDFRYWTPGPLTMLDIEPHYYYPTDVKQFMAIGVSLVVIGILIIRSKKK